MELSESCAAKPAFQCCALQDFDGASGSFDLIVDSGCFHHIKPHRRQQYLERIRSLLREDGQVLMTCMDMEAGAPISDRDVYRDFSMHGGMGFSEQKLRRILSEYFHIEELRKMQEPDDPRIFGEPFLWVVWMTKEHLR